MQHPRIVALDQHQLTLVRSNDIAGGIAVKRKHLRAKMLAKTDWVSDHSFTSPRFSR
ncbi:MAG: hypothetical protein HY525_16230 [Betaproteobacteria bacterium]|nr:hypothetical protein [Betaproteobacteria bacterium]